MQIIAINGSPRKKWNTATILENAVEGAAEAARGAQTEMFNLYDYNYKGCISCFECKRIGGPSYGKCAVRDDLQPILQKVLHADVVLFGSPIYFSDMTGMMRCFLERLYFPNFVYDKDYSSIAPKQLYSAFFYTMNMPASMMAEWHYPERLETMHATAGRLFGHKPEVEYVNNTYQFKDYSKYAASVFDQAAKAKYREEHFPQDCQKARVIGAELAKKTQG